ncbi:MAG: hypothetical protein WCS80_05490 [Bacilli bacterium]
MEDRLSKKNRYSSLVLIYGNLLTKVTLRRMKSFYLEDLSLSEIAQNDKVSRNAVFVSLLNGEKELDDYEKKLSLLEKEKTVSELMDEAEDCDDISKIKDLLHRMKGEISHGI